VRRKSILKIRFSLSRIKRPTPFPRPPYLVLCKQWNICINKICIHLLLPLLNAHRTNNLKIVWPIGVHSYHSHSSLGIWIWVNAFYNKLKPRTFFSKKWTNSPFSRVLHNILGKKLLVHTKVAFIVYRWNYRPLIFCLFNQHFCVRTYILEPYSYLFIYLPCLNRFCLHESIDSSHIFLSLHQTQVPISQSSRIPSPIIYLNHYLFLFNII
jgi:hypothetical protein